MSRTTIALRKALEAAAGESGRSLAQEVEFRLEQSFRDNDLHEILLGGKRASVLLHLISTIFKTAKTPDGRTWENDPEIANAVGIALNRLIVQTSGAFLDAADLLRVKPETERRIRYAAHMIANYTILSFRNDFDPEVMKGREGAMTPAEAIERYVVGKEEP